MWIRVSCFQLLLIALTLHNASTRSFAVVSLLLSLDSTVAIPCGFVLLDVVCKERLRGGLYWLSFLLVCMRAYLTVQAETVFFCLHEAHIWSHGTREGPT